jgi:DHA2 family lincomycin resistance protein-like MFS transporter
MPTMSSQYPTQHRTDTTHTRPSKSSNPSSSTFERRLDARLVIAVISTAVMTFAGVMVETAMNVTFPVLMEEFSISTSTVQWVTTANLLVLAVVVPVSAYLNRRFRTKPLFVVAIAFSLSGTLCGYFAASFSAVIVGRVLQGVGTGVAMPLMFNIITEQAPLKNMGVMMGIGSLIPAMAPAVGPSVGGWIAENLGWRMIFGSLLPVLLAALVLGVISIRQSHPTDRCSFDAVGWLLVAVSFAALIFATSMGPLWGWTSVRVIALFAGFALFLVLFVRREQAAQDPLISLSIFRQRGFVGGLTTLVFLQFIVLGLSFLLPNYSQLVMGTGSTEAGTILLYGCLLGACMAPVSGRVLDKFGARIPTVTGASCVLVATALFLAFSDHLHTLRAILIYILFAFGQGLMVGNVMTLALRFLPEATKADGTAAINTLQQLAGALGTSVTTALVDMSQQGATDIALATMAGSQAAFALLVAAAVVPLVCLLRITRKEQ